MLTHGLPCPVCQIEIFTEAHLVQPLHALEQELAKATPSGFNLYHSSLKIKESWHRSASTSDTSRSFQSSSNHSFFKTLREAQLGHSRKGSDENQSQSSSKGKRSSIFKSGSPSPRLHVSTAIFTDGRFVLAFTSNHISCYDCELDTWSKGHSISGIFLAAGSSNRYALVSRDNHVSLKFRILSRELS